MGIRRWRSRVEGQGLVEYSLILLFVTLAVFVTLITVGPIILGAFQRALDSFP